MSFKLGRWAGWETPAAPIVPETPDVQVTLPTSAYGQTIPVVYGKCRLPAAYIWVPPILTVTSTHIEYWDTITSTTAKMSARLRFARPLVPNSTWTMRKLYANGKLVYDGSIGYRQKGLKFTTYDGRSTQPRDPTMVSEEGEVNVSAHRGYLDIVVKDFDIIGLGAPPVFEAEWIQDGATTHDYESFTTLSSGVVNFIVPVWEDLEFYGYTQSGQFIRRFSLGALQEFYTISPVGGFEVLFDGWRYSRAYDRLFYMGQTGAGHWRLLVRDAQSGAVVATSDTVGTVLALMGVTCLIEIGEGAIYAGSTDDQQLFCYYYKASATETLTLATETAASWGGYASIQCLTPGANRGNEADVWVCADNYLVKVTFTALGTIKSTTVVATLADDLRYAVYDDGDVVVWTDAGTVKRINGTTGAVEFTKTVPYQIEVVTSRILGDPDLHRLTDELYYVTGSTSYFTNLDTGLTRSVTGATSNPQLYYYDGQTDTLLTRTPVFGVPQRMRIISDDGTQRQLEDFLVALMEAGGFDSSEIEVINVDDVIDGAVVDVTAGVRDIARSVCEPYSIAIFERAGQIIFKRAFTDGAFAIDATISSAGDISDSGGQAIKARRYNPEEFIARVAISYRDPAEIYQERPQFGEIPSLPLPVAPADQAVKLSMPIIVDADTVKILATQKVNRLAIERHEFQMTLRAKYADLEPEDVIRFTFANRTITARILECTVRPDYMIDITATEFLSSVSVSISGATGNPTEPNPVGTPESRYYHLDIPLLSDADDLAGSGLVQYHVLASAGQPYWDGATLYRKDATGQYQQVAGQVTNGLVGIALEALPDWGIPYVTEFSRSFDLAIFSGDTDLLTSATYLEMMNGANFFAIGQPGRWEVCQVITITNNGDGSYTFEGLRRGRKSSEEYTGLHAAGDFVVWLSEDNVQNIEYSIASLDEAFDFKSVGLGGSLAATAAVNRTVTGEAEKIPKPCQLNATVAGSDIALDWVRRARVGDYWSDDGDYTAPLAETLEQYIVRIKNGPGGSILRTFTVDDATTKTYLAANIATDFGSIPDQLTFDVRQVSGTGVICPSREATIDL
ncbi:hypothetical protein D3227_25740 [Mesorhizobium waimense]|uniref:Uncharacterized protein n=1 Tax=Mesorhizobium waimense TaxID=1300307 RepID=A0A3A5KJI5_9HYPH|nr:phage tail protein [Mesorhizobium waimense]RJT32805.1 hypothetical protein D3227_25740 [Mesorhizobium waimense]